MMFSTWNSCSCNVQDCKICFNSMTFPVGYHLWFGLANDYGTCMLVPYLLSQFFSFELFLCTDDSVFRCIPNVHHRFLLCDEVSHTYNRYGSILNCLSWTMWKWPHLWSLKNGKKYLIKLLFYRLKNGRIYPNRNVKATHKSSSIFVFIILSKCTENTLNIQSIHFTRFGSIEHGKHFHVDILCW